MSEIKCGPTCSCGQRSEERTALFNHLTSYWYCTKCKVEVVESKPESKDYSDFWDDDWANYYKGY